MQPALRCARAKRLQADIQRVYETNFSVYGVVKVWKQLQREGGGCGALYRGTVNEAIEYTRD